MKEIKTIIAEQRSFFSEHQTLAYEYRLKHLILLRDTIIAHQAEIYQALQLDLNKSEYEAFTTEYVVVLQELEYAIKHLKKWMKKKSLAIGLAQMPAKAYLHYEPYGVVLIFSPWNYPFQLAILPLIGAIAAGNCCVIKPSSQTANTMAIIETIIAKVFPAKYVAVINGGSEAGDYLLTEKFDYIFFTGSHKIGKKVLQKAADYLTPVTLELGGKSPCIVDKNINMEIAAKRILFGKLLNAGQTCIAPDYLLLHQDIKEQFVEQIKIEYKKMLGDTSYLREYYPKIINERHFKRIIELMKEGEIIFGGNYDLQHLQIELTLIDNPKLDSQLMNEEIFGPILPIISWRDKEEIVQLVNAKAKPLSLYIFSDDIRLQDYLIANISYGGGCINDTVMHIASNKQPFGGVGQSGIGRYRGKYSFETFSNSKNILKKSWFLDIKSKYHPYSERIKNLPNWFFN